MLDVITALINQELLHPLWEMTRQLLSCLEVELVNQLPRIEGIVVKPALGRATGYVAVKDEPFYIGVHFDIKDHIELVSIDTEPRIHLSYLASSEELDCTFLQGLTRLIPTRIIKSEDWQGTGWQYDYNGLSFESPDSPYSFDDKMDTFLSYLETDVSGIQALRQHTGDSSIFVTIYYHISNGNFTHLSISHDLIARLQTLGLMLTFDLYVRGKTLV